MLLLERAGSVLEERKRSSPARSLWLIGRSEVSLWRRIISGLLLLSCSLFSSRPLVCLLKASLVNKLLCFTYTCSFLSSLFVTRNLRGPEDPSFSSVFHGWRGSVWSQPLAPGWLGQGGPQHKEGNYSGWLSAGMPCSTGARNYNPSEGSSGGKFICMQQLGKRNRATGKSHLP